MRTIANYFLKVYEKKQYFANCINRINIIEFFHETNSTRYG